MEPNKHSRLKRQKVLILGGLGFIGSNLAAACLEQGAEVTIYDCLDPHSGGNMTNIASFEKHLQLVLNDIRNLDGVGMAFRDKDIVFNCAGFTSHPNSMRDPYEDIDVNCKGVVNVLEAGRRYNRDAKIVHVGTSTQIGKMQREPIDELHPEFPLDIYSANKTAGEKYTLIYGHAYGMRTTVVRLANTFGPRACIRTPEFGFMNFFVGLALQGKEITVFGEGMQKRNISYVEDSAAALIAAALDDASNGESFFATADEQITVRRVAEATAEVVGGKVRFVEWPPERAAIEIGDAVIANDKIRRTLDWKPEISLEEGLRRTRDYFQPRIKDYLR